MNATGNLLGSTFRRAIADVTNLLYPARCVCCEEMGMEEEPAFCRQCWEELSALAAEPACPRCAAPLAEGAACARCGGKGIYPFDKIAALGPFRDPLRKIVHQLKFHHRWPLAEILAERMLREDRLGRLLDETDVLVPVPLHWRRQIARGYNQSESLARGLAKHDRKIPVARPIVRLKATAAQTTVPSIAERAANMRGAFGLIDGKSIAGKRVTLVDDVMTTSATLHAAARELMAVKPANINAIVLAVADPRRRDFQMV
jgi:ComF family protein